MHYLMAPMHIIKTMVNKITLATGNSLARTHMTVLRQISLIFISFNITCISILS